MRTQQKAAIENKYGRKIPSHQLQLGIQIVKLPENRQYSTSLGEGKNGGRI
jgi:hypothetical protein